MRIEFIIPETLCVEAFQSTLLKNSRLLAETARTVYRTFYDSFDWRLYLENTLLEETCGNRIRTLDLRFVEGELRCPRLNLTEAPRFVRDLPQGPFRDLLAPVLEMRELVPMVRLRARSQTLRILNKDEKTIAYLVVEKFTLLGHTGTRTGKLQNRVTAIALQGCAKPYQEVLEKLRTQGLIQASDDLMLAALAVTGVTPGNYSSKLDLKLDPSLRADQANKVILRRLLDIMLQNEAGTRTGTDTEFLHDFRVAIRRTRSAITQIKAVFPQRIVNRYKTEFAWLGQKTTPTRDLDVYLLNFDEYRDSLPIHARSDIEPLREFLIRHHQLEHRALLKTLGSARYHRLIKNWRTYLDQPVNERTTLQQAGRPVSAVACERIWSAYQRVLREGNAIHLGSAAEALHDLRKTCKKLRYLMEFFQSLFPSSDIKKLIRILKTLQDNLGDFQDYEVQVITLKEFSHQMVAEGTVPSDTLLAMGMLIDGLERRQHQAHEDFFSRYAGFSQRNNQNQFRKLFTTRT